MPGRRARLAGGLRAEALTGLLTALVVVAAYRSPTVMRLDLGNFPSGLLVDGFFESEGAFRWSRAESSIRFPDAGATPHARLSLELSGFRPPGAPPPLVVVESGGSATSIRPERRFQTYAFDTSGDGALGSSLEVRLRSETFSPGQGDGRALGVRVSRATLSLDRGAWAPARQVLLAVVAVLLLRRRVRRRRRALTAAALMLLAGAYAGARIWACLLVGPVALGLAAGSALGWLAPRSRRALSSLAEQLFREMRRSAAFMLTPRSLTVTGLAVLLVPLAYLATPELVVDLGSGAAEPIARRFGPLDRDGPVTFRRALPGASIDLRDFGASGSWRVALTAALEEGSATGTWLRAGDREIGGPLGEAWTTGTVDSGPVPWGGRSGIVLELPGVGRAPLLRVDRIEIDRGRSLPPLRPWGLIVAVVTIASAAGLSAWLGGVVLAALGGLLVAFPVVLVPLLPVVAVGALAAWPLAAAARTVFGKLSERPGPAVPDTAVAAALLAFLVAFAALASPLYVGGHYTYHSNIAEEISRGAFLTYYLPYPENMLSRQPQWGDIVVPHPSLYHTLASPAALLPGGASDVATKLLLAALLFGVAVAAAWTATELRGPRAGVATGLSAALLPTGYQLLGLGHLMALFGTWAASIALGYVAVRAQDLLERGTFRVALGLVTLCFLSYTGSLLFASIALLAAAGLAPSGSALRRGGIRLVLAGWLVAFLLYYVHWTLPFLRESLPALLGGAGGGSSVDLAARVGAVPSKLAYTFGSAWVPLLAALGLLAARPGPGRRVLAAWLGVLAGFSGLDLFFNFLLKHHYFAFPVVAIGAGLGLSWLSERGLEGRIVAAALALALAGLGAVSAWATASGTY